MDLKLLRIERGCEGRGGGLGFSGGASLSGRISNSSFLLAIETLDAQCRHLSPSLSHARIHDQKRNRETRGRSIQFPSNYDRHL